MTLVAHAEPSATDATSAEKKKKKDDELHWHDEWPRFRTAEYIATPIAGAASFAVFYALKAPSEPHWTGGILFDDAVRDALHVHSESTLEFARKASDLTGLAAIVWAVGVDSVIVPVARGSTDVAWQMVLMDAESYAFSSLITTTAFKTVGRARPSYEDCIKDPSVDSLCRSAPTSSFPSGHANQAFTAAGLSCAHHLHLHVYGNQLADVLACAGTTALATATSTFRIMADRHYLTDVLTGGGIGFGLGYGLPTLLHYAAGDRRGDSARVTLAPFAMGPGVAVLGRF